MTALIKASDGLLIPLMGQMPAVSAGSGVLEVVAV